MHKCDVCGSEWNSTKQSTTCPFCGAELNEDVPLNISEAIKKIIAERGLDILNNPSIVISLVTDYVRGYEREKKLLRVACNSGVLALVHNITGITNEEARNIEIQKVQHLLKNEAFLSEEYIDVVLSTIFEGVGVKYVKSHDNDRNKGNRDDGSWQERTDNTAYITSGKVKHSQSPSEHESRTESVQSPSSTTRHQYDNTRVPSADRSGVLKKQTPISNCDATLYFYVNMPYLSLEKFDFDDVPSIYDVYIDEKMSCTIKTTEKSLVYSKSIDVQSGRHTIEVVCYFDKNRTEMTERVTSSFSIRTGDTLCVMFKHGARGAVLDISDEP